MPLYKGAVAPETYKALILTGSSGLDMTTVTAAVFLIEKPNGSTVSWTASISGATTTQLTLTHQFNTIGFSEVDVDGEYHVYARLTVPGGFMGTTRVNVPVKDEFEPT